MATQEWEMADLRNGIRSTAPTGSQLGDCWQQGTWWPGTGTAAAEMGAVLGVKVVLLGSNRACKDVKKSETPNKKATLLGFL